MRRLLFALSLTVSSPVMAQSAPSTAASGTDIPEHDIAFYCGKRIIKDNAIVQSGDDPRYRAGCMRTEQTNLDLIAALWPSATDATRRESIRYAAQYRESGAYYTALSEYLVSFMRDAETEADVRAASR